MKGKGLAVVALLAAGAAGVAALVLGQKKGEAAPTPTPPTPPGGQEFEFSTQTPSKYT